MTRPWDSIITDTDRAAYAAAGFGQSTGIGRHPVLLVIDVQYRTTGSRSLPILEAIKEYPTACGEYAWSAIPNMARLIAAFRGAGFPVIYPCVARKGVHDDAGFGAKAPGILGIAERGYDFVEEIAPLPGELRLPKAHASAFFGTALASYLVRFGADSLVVTGCSTSGCVRASVVDACQLNYKVVVAEDACYDRGQVSHAVNLFDMASKYADVASTTEVLEMLEAARR